MLYDKQLCIRRCREVPKPEFELGNARVGAEKFGFSMGENMCIDSSTAVTDTSA
jgi:hypothetical protein